MLFYTILIILRLLQVGQFQILYQAEIKLEIFFMLKGRMQMS